MSSEAYERAKGGRLTFKGGSLATRTKPIDKKKHKKQKPKPSNDVVSQDQIFSGEETGEADTTTLEGSSAVAVDEGEGGETLYTIDAAKRMKYEDLFPVEAKKFRYKHPKEAQFKSMEEALDDRVKKKADRYCK